LEVTDLAEELYRHQLGDNVDVVVMHELLRFTRRKFASLTA